MDRLQKQFEAIGAEFAESAADLSKRMARVRAFVFDWDGVFHDGRKSEVSRGSFSEADSMGTNMLRFGHYLGLGEIPFTGIITGLQQPAAFELSKREYFNAVYYGFGHKVDALRHLTSTYGIYPEEIAFVFDDILDLSMARECGFRLCVRRQASPLFLDYVREEGIADYITGTSSGLHPVREVCELMLGLSGRFRDTISQRERYTSVYQEYLGLRRQQVPAFYTKENLG